MSCERLQGAGPLRRLEARMAEQSMQEIAAQWRAPQATAAEKYTTTEPEEGTTMDEETLAPVARVPVKPDKTREVLFHRSIPLPGHVDVTWVCGDVFVFPRLELVGVLDQLQRSRGGTGYPVHLIEHHGDGLGLWLAAIDAERFVVINPAFIYPDLEATLLSAQGVFTYTEVREAIGAVMGPLVEPAVPRPAIAGHDAPCPGCGAPAGHPPAGPCENHGTDAARTVGAGAPEGDEEAPYGRTPHGEPIEMVQATPEGIAQAVSENEERQVRNAARSGFKSPGAGS